MPKHKDPLVAALLNGDPYVFTVPDGGDLASMRAILKHGQKITFAPVKDTIDIHIGDIVIVKWRGSNYMMHVVQDIQGGNYLIANSLGKINGWVSAADLIGVAVQVVDPPPRPAIPQMLEHIRELYLRLNNVLALDQLEAERVLSIHADLSWYAGQIGENRCGELPRQNLWNYESHLWHLLKELAADINSGELNPAAYYINHAKEHIGQVAIALRLFEGY